jgi:putative transcriptional regulator
MSKTDTTRITVKPGEELPRGETDWARVNAMTNEEVMAAALSDPDAQPLDPEALAKMRRVSPVKVLRQRLGMTQTEFAEAFRLPVSTLRDWEQHRSIPDAPAPLLRAIDRDHETMRRLLIAPFEKIRPNASPWDFQSASIFLREWLQDVDRFYREKKQRFNFE